MSNSKILFSQNWKTLFLAIFATFLIAGCATPKSNKGQNIQSWSGRISLEVQSLPPQSLTSSFALIGSAQTGQLRLQSAIGTTVAVLNWSPTQALLNSGAQRIETFSSVQELMENSLGAAVPLTAFFDWLDGKPTAIEGWQTDLSQHANGRIQATRSWPLPAVELRLILEK